MAAVVLIDSQALLNRVRQFARHGMLDVIVRNEDLVRNRDLAGEEVLMLVELREQMNDADQPDKTAVLRSGQAYDVMSELVGHDGYGEEDAEIVRQLLFLPWSYYGQLEGGWRMSMQRSGIRWLRGCLGIFLS